MTKQVEDILLTNTSNNKSLKNVSNANKEVKQEASLFDKLLANNPKEQNQNQELKQETKLDTPLPSEKQTDKSTVAQTENKNISTTNTNSASLLDRLILEAKKNTQNSSTNSEESENKQTIKTNTSSETTIILDNKKQETKTDKQLSEIKPEVKPEIKIQANTSEIKNPDNNISLDSNTKKVVADQKEILENIKTPQTIKTNENKETIESSEQKAEQKIELKSDLKNEVKINEITNTTNNPISNSNVSQVKNETVEENIVVNEKTSQVSNSLNNTDELVLDNKKIETKNNKSEIKVNEVENLKNETTSTTSSITKEVVLKETNQNSLLDNTKAKQETQTLEVKKQTTSTLEEPIENKNSKLAKDLDALNTNTLKNEKVNITKDEIEALSVKQKDEPKSLMDSLIEKSKNVKNQTTLNENETTIVKNTDNANKEVNSKSVISNIYLSSQQNNINNSALANKAQAINAVKDATTIEEIEVNAKKLDLNAKDISVETKTSEINNNTTNLLDRKNSLDKLALNNNARNNEMNTLVTKSVEASKVILSNDTINIDNEVTVNVNSTLAQNIETRIIAARQQLSSMMSDVARRMYENYKPPVTAFRINLNPAALGNIAIVMKSDKDNGINISLNISNSATLDAFVDGQNSLRSALNKTFDENAVFNLDFNSNEQNNNNSQNQDDSNKSFTNESDTQTILEAREKNIESEDKNLDYM